MFVHVYILTYLSAPVSIPLRTMKYIEIPKPDLYQSLIQKKGPDQPVLLLVPKKWLTRFTVFFVLIVKQRRYFGERDRLICLWKSPWEGIPSPKFIWAKYVAFYSCSFFYLSYSNHTFQCWTGGFTLMRWKVFLPTGRFVRIFSPMIESVNENSWSVCSR